MDDFEVVMEQDNLIAFLTTAQGQRMEQSALRKALGLSEQRLLDLADPLIEAGHLHRFTLMTGTWYSVRGMGADQTDQPKEL